MHLKSNFHTVCSLFLHPPPVEPPPNGLEYYIHRTGRTGRKGQPGLAILVYSGGENVHGIDAGDLLRQVGVVSCTEPPTLSLPIITYTAIVLGLCPRTWVSLLPWIPSTHAITITYREPSFRAISEIANIKFYACQISCFTVCTFYMYLILRID